jgi:hypothetical protein
MLRIDCRKRSWLGIVHRLTVRRITLVGTTAVFDLSSTSYTSNINCLCRPETAKTGRTAANRIGWLRLGPPGGLSVVKRFSSRDRGDQIAQPTVSRLIVEATVPDHNTFQSG